MDLDLQQLKITEWSIDVIYYTCVFPSCHVSSFAYVSNEKGL